MAITEQNMDQENEKASSFANFPEAIIVKILAKLPVDCLLRFRCVSKSWRFLISTDYFMKTHIDSSKNKLGSAQYRLVLISSFPRSVEICSVLSVRNSNNSSLDLSELDRFFQTPRKSLRILGSCNGLLCLSTVCFKLLLWNPSLRKSIEFSDSFVQTKSGCYIRYGFGYDEVMNDYKVVKIFSSENDGDKQENTVRVYSLKANSWSMMSGFSSGYLYGKCGVFLNGALHWETHRQPDNVWEITALDLAEDRNRIVALPSCEEGLLYWWCLGVSRGSLVGCCVHHPKTMNVWVMEEYGVVESWTKVVSVSLPDDHRGYISLLHMSDNGDEYLLKLGAELVVYNRRNGSFKKLDRFASGRALELQTAMYSESLALLDTGIVNNRIYEQE